MKEIAIAIQSKVFSLFDYVHDIDNYMMMEHWTSHAAAVNEGKRFRDDCDGFAMTCCELLIEAGVPRENILFIICKTETGEGHAVCGVHIDDTTYILENRYREIYDWKNRQSYQWIYKMNFAEPGVWRKITNA
jgi:predicted transglutaminase-like cysteine proteinase